MNLEFDQPTRSPANIGGPGVTPVVTVSQLARMAKQALEQLLPLMWIAGEISNFTKASSGHWYFSLKDDKSQIRCVLYRHKSQFLDWVPTDGMQVEVRATATIYEPRGEFQLCVEQIKQSGLGALYEAFERLKAKLTAQGLFDPRFKLAIPTHPRQVGIVTSTAAAALRDVLTTLRRRMPSLPVIVYPTPVQGEGSAEQIAYAIRTAVGRAECDVLIVCRGGGSIEDLWSFNTEVVAQAIHGSTIPIISGVGHETDFTIADFVADQRAATPTAAAELVSPNRSELLQRLAALQNCLSRCMTKEIEQRMQQTDYIGRRLIHPAKRIEQHYDRLNQLRFRLNIALQQVCAAKLSSVMQYGHRLSACQPKLELTHTKLKSFEQRLHNAARHTLDRNQTALERMQSHLMHLNPEAVLARGYSITRTTSGEIVRSSKQVKKGAPLEVTLAEGKIDVTVEKTVLNK